ncbi:nucleoside recognition domain-containing protein [Caldalkalibacillus salinus]|uniref:nucleoside recognition domain-containing protein n=1 Tax=Caldalkalibacillus salinus TaxID=2803787 RepID=UPI00192485B4|nr:nucleoside recognition domain-containing protein [Caldalkalibacillus salinus]
MDTLKAGIKAGLQTTWVLGKVIFPVTLIVTLLSFTPVIDWIVVLFEPLMRLIGLPGEAAIPFVLANFLNLYAGIGAVLSLSLDVKEVFILAVMMSLSHNLFIETAVAVKVGIKAWVAVTVRLGLAFLSAFLIHLFWSGGQTPAQYGMIPNTSTENIEGWLAMTLHALNTAVIGILQLAMIVIPLMIFIQWMKDRDFLKLFTRWMRPATKVLGLSPNTSTTLGAGLLFGLAYGAGVIIQAVKEDNMSQRDVYLLFIFLVACHAVVEDTLIFLPLGIPLWPLLLTRLVLAILLTIAIGLLWKRTEHTPSQSYLKEETNH